MLILRNLRFEVIEGYTVCSPVQGSSDSFQDPGMVRMLSPQLKQCHTQVPVLLAFTDQKIQMSNDVL